MNNFSEAEKIKSMEAIQRNTEGLPVFVNTYISSILSRKDTAFRTAKAYSGDIKTFFNYFVNERKMSLNEITPEYLGKLKPMDIETYLGYLTAYMTPEDIEYNKTNPRNPRIHKMNASARARNLAAIRGLYHFLQINDYVETNPASLAKTPIAQKKEVIALNRNEVHKLVKNVENTNYGAEKPYFAEKQKFRDIAIIKLFLYTGLRVSELVGLDLNHINWDEKYVLVDRKGGKQQQAFFNDEAKEALLDYINLERKESDYETEALFISRKGERLSVRSVERVVKKYSRASTVKKITPHKLRATYATQLYKSTSDVMKVKDSLAHDSWIVTRYVDQSQQNRREAALDINYDGDDN